MMEPVNIRITDGDEAIFRDILRSLESHRPSKTDKDILNEIQQQFSLPNDTGLWVDILIRNNVSVETFINFVLQLIAPFVEMILDIYNFLSQYVSTTGGRTTHFEIHDDKLEHYLKFPDANLPRKTKFIQVWEELKIELLSIDWNQIQKIFRIDNGRFYGTVKDVRFLQFLIIARSEGKMSDTLQDIGNKIYKISKKILKSWFFMQKNNLDFEYDNIQSKLVLSSFVPEQLYSDMVKHGFICSSSEFKGTIGIDTQVILFWNLQPYSIEEAFIDLNSANVTELDCDETNEEKCGLAAIAFFVALWGLDETSFKTVTRLLTVYEKQDILDVNDSERTKALGEEVIFQLESAIEHSGEQENFIQNLQKKLEIILLPYWRDRWFLYEVWTLCLPLIEALSVDAVVELIGVSSIANTDVEGTSWNLPTQKARQPVAKILDNTLHHKLSIWFQRETKRYDNNRNIEPDIRITFPYSPYVDLLILECKDRVKFRENTAIKVAEAYLKGTAARKVWIVNYELSVKKEHGLLEVKNIEERQLGVAYGFRPNLVDETIRASISELLQECLCLSKQTFQITEHYLLIDSSGSMKGKVLPELPLFRQLLNKNPQNIYYWHQIIGHITDGEARKLLHHKPVSGSGVEDGKVFVEFVNALPKGAKVTLITDITGMEGLKVYMTPLENQLEDLHYAYQISDKVLEVIVI